VIGTLVWTTLLLRWFLVWNIIVVRRLVNVLFFLIIFFIIVKFIRINVLIFVVIEDFLIFYRKWWSFLHKTKLYFSNRLIFFNYIIKIPFYINTALWHQFFLQSIGNQHPNSLTFFIIFKSSNPDPATYSSSLLLALFFFIFL
jgi:hypothetical protein